MAWGQLMTLKQRVARLKGWCRCGGRGYWMEQIDGPHNMRRVDCPKGCGFVGNVSYDDTLANNAEAVTVPAPAPAGLNWRALLVPVLLAMPWTLLYVVYKLVRHLLQR